MAGAAATGGAGSAGAIIIVYNTLATTSRINAQSDATVGTLTKSGDATGNLTLQTNGNSALTFNSIQTITLNGTGAFTVPVGNTAQRPSPAENGMIRYNTTTLKLEGYINSTWANII